MQLLKQIRWGSVLRRLSPTRILLLLVVTVPFFNEFLSYIIQPWLWPQLPNLPVGNSVRVLFVADAQIQGFQDESPIFGSLTRWDADRYLQRTFCAAYFHHQPDVVVFLGDLLDEGSKANNEEYEAYYTRFKNIFQTQEVTKHVYLSGDNDVGGEGFDSKVDWKVNRFHNHFNQFGVTKVKFVDFMRLHWDLGSEYVGDLQNEAENLKNQATSEIRILINHMGILTRAKREFQKAILYTCINCYEEETWQNSGNRWRGGIRDMSDSSTYSFKLNDGVSLHEIVVPSCSYRMGVPRMGYGAAVIGADNDMTYTVLWLPSRYNQLYSYVFFLAVLAIFTIVHLCLRLWFSWKAILSR